MGEPEKKQCDNCPTLVKLEFLYQAEEKKLCLLCFNKWKRERGMK